MTEIEAALAKYLNTKEKSEINLEDSPRSTRPGMEALKREAQTQLEAVRNEYGEILRKNLFAISVSGPGTESFVARAMEEAEILVVDANSLYVRIADRVAPMMGDGGNFGVSQYSAVIQELRTIGSELHITSMDSPRWSEPVNVGTYKGLLAHITSMVDSATNLELNSLYVNGLIQNKALEMNVDKNVVPVILTGVSEERESEFLTKAFTRGRNAVVRTDKEEVNSEFVLEVFNNIKKTLKSIKKN